MFSRFRRVAGACGAAGILVISLTGAPAVAGPIRGPVSPNLLVNPGAETGDPSLSGYSCAVAFVTGIEGRRDRISCPRWVGLFRWLKPVLSTPVGELPIRTATAELLPRIDAEAAALGRSMSASNVDLVRETPS